MTNSADPGQLCADLDLHCLLRQGMSCSAREGLKHVVGTHSNNLIEVLLMSTYNMSQRTTKPTIRLVQPVKTQTGLHIHAV